MRFAALLLLSAGALTANLASCSESTPAQVTGAPTPDGGGDVPDAAGPGPFDTPASPCTDPADSIYGDPGALAADDSAKGNLVKCAAEPAVTKDTMQAKLTALGYTGKPLTSDAKVFRISYRTERGDTANTPVAASALVYMPATPRGAKLPIVVASHGSRGQTGKCAVTKFDPSLEGINDDAYRMTYSLVGHGYAMILPDLSGYANYGAANMRPPTYAQAVDVGRATLDAARALKKLFPNLDDKVVLVGHSQGGNTALSALAIAESYGSAGPVVGAALYAPLWVSQRSWGAAMFAPASPMFPLATSAVGNISVWYHYTEAELLDGPGEGIKLFATDKQAAIESFVKNDCWDSKSLADADAGRRFTSDLFDIAFENDVASSAATPAKCTTDRCTKWLARYAADRPHLTGAAATTPLLVVYGLKDSQITPDRMRCAVDRLKTDGAKMTFCADADPDHNTIVSARGDYVSDWIANLTLGEPAPAACATNESVLTAVCPSLPPND